VYFRGVARVDKVLGSSNFGNMPAVARHSGRCKPLIKCTPKFDKLIMHRWKIEIRIIIKTLFIFAANSKFID
jgi:hypothetical protein